MNKKAVELSINFVVILIIAIAVLGLSLAVLRTIIETGTDILEETGPEAKGEINRQLNAGSWVATYPSNVRDVHRGDTVTIHVGIRNNEDVSRTFDFGVSVVTAQDPQRNPIGVTSLFQVQKIAPTESIELGETVYAPFLLEVPDDVPDGTYVVDVQATHAGGNYLRPVKAYLHIS